MALQTRITKFINSIDTMSDKEGFKAKYGEAPEREEFLVGAKDTIKRIFEVAVPDKLSKEVNTKDLRRMEELKGSVAEAYEEHKHKLNSTRGNFWKEILSSINKEQEKAENRLNNREFSKQLPKPNMQVITGSRDRSYSADNIRALHKKEERRHSRW